MPCDATRWTGHQQHEQHHHGSDESCNQKGAEKPHSTIGAAEPGENAEYDVKDRLDHYAISPLSTATRARPPCAATRRVGISLKPMSIKRPCPTSLCSNRFARRRRVP